MGVVSRRNFVGALMLTGTIASGSAVAEDRIALPAIDVYTRLGSGIVGASTSVITSEEIMRSPGQSIQDIIAREPGVQTWSVFGAVNGAGTTIDLRGFGASAASNTLVLLNGRRLTDIDLAGVDFSAISRESIERIEITRGNSGTVLYGDGAVGGVVNIVTKTGENLPPSLRIGGGFGTFNQREGNFSANASAGGFSAAMFGNAFDSDGFRKNNALQQRSVAGDFRYNVGGGTFYLNVTADDQKLGLPGARKVTLTTSELVTDPTGATTPTAFANKQGVSATLGYSRTLINGIEMIVDGGVRQKEQQTFSEISGFQITDKRKLTTFSFTPRKNSGGVMLW